MSRIDEIRARVKNAKECGLTGPAMAQAVFEAYVEDVPYLLSELATKETIIRAYRSTIDMLDDRIRELEAELKQHRREAGVNEKHF